MIRGVTLALAVVLAVVVAPAAADAQTKERAAARAGIEAYNEGDYDKALKKLQEASAGIALLELPEQVTVHKYTAYCQIAFGRRDDARTQFKQAVVLDPALTLPSGTSPKILDVFDEAKAELAAKPAAGDTRLTDLPGVDQPIVDVGKVNLDQNIVGLRMTSMQPVGGYGGAGILYSGELVNQFESGRFLIEIALGYRGNTDKSIRTIAREAYGDIGAGYYLRDYSWVTPGIHAGTGIHSVIVEYEDLGVRKNETSNGAALWAGVSGTFLRRQSVHLVGSVRYQVIFNEINEVPSNGVVFGISATFTTGSKPCCL